MVCKNQIKNKRYVWYARGINSENADKQNERSARSKNVCVYVYVFVRTNTKIKDYKRTNNLWSKYRKNLIRLINFFLS